jgi:hypothetical protein
MEVGVGQGIGQLAEVAALHGPAAGDGRAGPPQPSGEGDLGAPGVVLALQVGERAEQPQGQEARLEVADRALGAALGLGLAGPQDDGPGTEGPEQARHLGMEPGGNDSGRFQSASQRTVIRGA